MRVLTAGMGLGLASALAAASMAGVVPRRMDPPSHPLRRKFRNGQTEMVNYMPPVVTGLRYPTNGKREVARRARQIANGQLQVSA